MIATMENRERRRATCALDRREDLDLDLDLEEVSEKDIYLGTIQYNTTQRNIKYESSGSIRPSKELNEIFPKNT